MVSNSVTLPWCEMFQSTGLMTQFTLYKPPNADGKIYEIPKLCHVLIYSINTDWPFLQIKKYKKIKERKKKKNVCMYTELTWSALGDTLVSTPI